jgi:hypothetical protein
MMSRFAPVLAALFLGLVACTPVEPEAPVTGGPQPGDLIAGQSDGGLVEREPDLCQAAMFRQYLGQPGSIVSSLALRRPFRVVPFGGIVTQEYDPNRINFWLSQTGEIQRIGCG